MRNEPPPLVKLADYRPPAFLIDETHLAFMLAPAATRVTARLRIRRNGEHNEPLRLDGERLKPISLGLDGRALGPAEYLIDGEGLTIAGVPDAFVLESEVEIDPRGNASLEGLYLSAGRFCTQCEAEGFRKITWFADRPDVLSRFTVRLEAPSGPGRLLSNGNLVDSGETPEGRSFAVWNDPFPKPCYLFALVAGELDVLEDSFVTMGGRSVTLRIFVDPGSAPRAAYAMDALKRAMRWDEEAFGREYDLDLFMIVAVRDFNFGAMENKGLNIFNSSLLLADAATATDLDFERIEAVVAHEYFHNWTGNRITCRDWFQLCLKEGLTVFRDQSFSADQRGEAVQRIKAVKALRARQFSEDAGPLAHPVRPSAYAKIDNFYTATVYDKGAEVIRMLKVIVGARDFRRGMDLYFERWDGHATTVEAFIACFAETSGRDLSGFFTWYGQIGTPSVEVESRHDPASGVLDLTIRQRTGATPGRSETSEVPIPIAFGLIDEDGRSLGETRTVVLEQAERRVRLEGLPRRPVLSILRGFSAPVNLCTDAPVEDAYVLLAADPDLFNRWEAGQGLARALLLARAGGRPDEAGEVRFARALGRSLDDQASDPALKALLLSLPSETDLAVLSVPADPAAIHRAREALRFQLATRLGDALRRWLEGGEGPEPFSPDSAAAGRRSLRNAALELLAADPCAANRRLARGRFETAANMTDTIGALNALVLLGGKGVRQALTAFHERWKNEPLVIDKWFALQARDPSPQALARVVGLTTHPAFDPRNPNRLRALVQTFATANPARFHDADGAGYRFLADQLLAVDPFNPMTAARLIEPLAVWERYRPELAALMRAELERIVETKGLSKNVFELAARALRRAS